MKKKNSPIIEFKDDKELNACLKEWQHLLFLDTWNIRGYLVDNEQLTYKNSRGENLFEPEISVSVIKIKKVEASDKPTIDKICHELILVHELLHCIYLEPSVSSENLEGIYFYKREHQKMHDLAKSLFIAKYGLSRDWFVEEEKE